MKEYLEWKMLAIRAMAHLKLSDFLLNFHAIGWARALTESAEADIARMEEMKAEQASPTSRAERHEQL